MNDIADLRNRLGLLYNRVSILEGQTPNIAITSEDREKIFNLLKKSDEHFRKAWGLLGEARHMMAPEKKIPRGFQSNTNGEQKVTDYE